MERDSRRRGGRRHERKGGSSRSGARRSAGGRPKRVPISADAYRQTRSRRQPQCRHFQFGCAALAVLLLCGGGGSGFGLGLALLVAGGALLLTPPRHGLGRRTDLAIAAFCLAPLLVFLPWPGFFEPGWKGQLRTEAGIALPRMMTVHPLPALEAWLCLLAGIGWLYCVMDWPLNNEGRRVIYQRLSILAAVLGLVLLAGNLLGWRHPVGGSAVVFGLLDDARNNGAVLAMVGTVAFGLAMEGIRVPRPASVLGFVGCVLALVGIIVTPAYGPLLVFIFGIAGWFLLRLSDSPVGRPVKGAALLAVLSVVLYSLAQAPPPAANGSAAAALSIAADFPFTGAGAGSFPWVLPQYAAYGEVPAAEFPSSSVLRLAAENGMAALLAGLLAAALLLSRLPFRRYGRDLALSAPAAAAVAGGAGYVLFAPTGYAVAPAMLGLLLLPAALGEGREPSARRSLPAWAGRSLGTVLALVGCAWMAAAILDLPLRSEQRRDRLEAQLRAAGDRSPAPRVEAAGPLIAAWPLDWRSYHRRAEAALDGGRIDAAHLDFARARAVNPSDPAVPLAAGRVLLGVDAAAAAAAWRQALEGLSAADRLGNYRAMLAAAGGAALPVLVEVAADDPELRQALLLFLPPERFPEVLGGYLEEDPALAGFDSRGRWSVVLRWIRSGAVADAATFVDLHGDALEPVWRLRAEIEQRLGNFRAAATLMRDNLPAAPPLAAAAADVEVARLHRQLQQAADNPSKRAALFHHYMDRRAYADALAVLDLEKAAVAAVPPGEHFWIAEAFFRLGDFASSWEAFRRYDESARRSGPPDG